MCSTVQRATKVGTWRNLGRRDVELVLNAANSNVERRCKLFAVLCETRLLTHCRFVCVELTKTKKKSERSQENASPF